MIRAIVTDIEGTTTRLSFVHDVLFPYARERLHEWVFEHPDDPAIAAARTAAGQPDADLDGVVAILTAWMDTDTKITPLKAIQGRIWEQGFGSGVLLAHVYPDVPTALAAWRARGIVLAVYSSGSLLAQQQLFGHTEAGDLRPLFSSWFDTTTGPKRERASYECIAGALGFAPAEVLFLSDTPEELDAARAAGLAVTRVDRDGSAGVRSFAEITVGA